MEKLNKHKMIQKLWKTKEVLKATNLTKHLIIGIWVAIGVMITCGVCVATFTIKSWKDSDERIKMEKEYNKAKIEQLDKPTQIIQKYYSPQNYE